MFLLLAVLGCSGGGSAEVPTDDEDTPSVTDAASDTDAPSDTDVPSDTDAPPAPKTVEDCFGALWGSTPPVDYPSIGATMGSHCVGTNHQDIGQVERVVFIGDSITAGSPPTAVGDRYRNILTDGLIQRYGLEEPSSAWRTVDLFSGVTDVMESGDFATCAQWGARTDDLLLDPHKQLETCIPEDRRDKATLVIMTAGGNDHFALLEDVGAGVDEATLRAQSQQAAQYMREAAEWVSDPTRFPNGAWLIFANTYDFTDAWGAEDMARCPGADLIGMSSSLREPVFQDIMREFQETYLSIAVETGTDMVFLGEVFCGHGYTYDDASGRCYRGPSAALYLDFTCMHPSAAGHEAIARAFFEVVKE